MSPGRRRYRRAQAVATERSDTPKIGTKVGDVNVVYGGGSGGSGYAPVPPDVTTNTGARAMANALDSALDSAIVGSGGSNGTMAPVAR